MNASTLKKLTISSAAIAILLSGVSAAVAAEPANMSNASIVLDQHHALGANDCISLGSQHHMARESIDAITPVLRNHCDYAVSVSYCIANDNAAVRACDSGPERVTRTLRAHETIRVEAKTRTLIDKDVNWIACRSVAGVASRFSDDGTRGQCLPDNMMQATAQPTTITR